MDPRDYVDTRTKRYMAQALEEFEQKIETPLARVIATRGDGGWDAATLLQIQADLDGVKRTFRKRLQALGTDCLDLISPDLSINGFEPVATRR